MDSSGTQTFSCCSSFLDFPKNYKKTTIGIVTLVALLALALVATGILFLFAPNALSLLATLHKIALPLGISFTIMGSILLIALSILTLSYCCTAKEHLRSQELGDNPVQNNNTEDPSHTNSQQSQSETEKPDGLSKPPHADGDHVPQTFEDVLKELQIDNYEERMQAIYGSFSNRPNVPRNPAFLVAGEKLENYARYIKLCLCSDKELLENSLECIANLSWPEQEIIFLRLYLIDKNLKYLTVDAKTWDWQNLKTITLAQFRSFSCYSNLDLNSTAIPPILLGMLTDVQIYQLLHELPEDQMLDVLLPTNSKNRSAYSGQRLKKLNSVRLIPRLKNCSCDLLRQLPLEFFKLDQFPWEKVLSSHENFRMLFTTDWDKLQETKKIFAQITFERLKTFTPYLTAEHLPLILPQHLTQPDFPWSQFIQTKGIALKLRQIAEDVFATAIIPWKLLAKNENAIAELFPTAFPLDETTVKILRALPLKAICDLASSLKIDHLAHFTEEQLLNKEFPWAEFINKEGFGRKLNWLRPRELQKKIVTSAPIPWKLLAQKQKEVDEFLPTSYPQDETTVRILKALPIHAIRDLAPSLKTDHLFHFTEEQLLSKEFPWAEFINKEGFGRKLNWLSPRELQIKIVTSAHIPWKLLAQKQKEVDQLLPITYPQEESTRTILKNLKRSAISELACALKAEHLTLFSEDQLEDKNFPWSTFLDKDRVGSQIHYLSAKVLAARSIPWGNMKLQDVREVFKFSHYGDSGTRQKLEAIGKENIRLLYLQGKLTQDQVNRLDNSIRDFVLQK